MCIEKSSTIQNFSVSAGHYSDIESGRRNPPDREILSRMTTALNLSDGDKDILTPYEEVLLLVFVQHYGDIKVSMYSESN